MLGRLVGHHVVRSERVLMIRSIAQEYRKMWFCAGNISQIAADRQAASGNDKVIAGSL